MVDRTYTGIVIFHLPAKGYGYLRIPDTREEFHFKSVGLSQAVKAGDYVRFKLKQSKQGYFADEIELLKIA
jgi:cold shock CspA family protein